MVASILLSFADRSGNAIVGLIKILLNVLRFAFKSVVMRRSIQRLQSRLHDSPALLENVSQFMRQQALPGDGVRFVAPLSKVNVATRSEGVSLNIARGLGSRSVAVDSYVIKTLAEALFHCCARVRSQRRTRTTPAHSVVKFMRGCGRASFSFALHRLLLTLFAGASAACASAAGHIGPTQNRRSRGIPGQRSASGALDGHITHGAQEIWKAGKSRRASRLHRRDAARLRLMLACFQRR